LATYYQTQKSFLEDMIDSLVGFLKN